MKRHGELFVPALRAAFGDWIYYSCVMPLGELAARVSYAEEIHEDKALSGLIQRSLEGTRATHISEYLEKTEQRFFNSLVVATYGERPKWLEVGNFNEQSEDRILDRIDPQERDVFGYLALSGREKIFAVDGQHRLAGVKRAVSQGLDFGTERISVLFVAHNEAQRQRTRRLFTTLNKTARPVKKLDIIALDEDDTMAIVTRRLVESNEWFKSPKIAVISSVSLPVTNRSALTTIANLYDVLKLVFKFKEGKKSDRILRFYRPKDKALTEFEEYAVGYFTALQNAFPPVKELFRAKGAGPVTQKYRGPHGGHLLFRPAGLEAFTQVAVEYSLKHHCTLSEAVDVLKEIPTDLSARPYRDVLWDPTKKTMISKGKPLAKDLLRYMARLIPSSEVKDRYDLAVGKTRVLPTRLKVP
ncbi:DGQHR domain-containing protein [Xanthomonas campestris]|uniref:DGQHR domain-containing protein n=1 Tax=Xanthomonas campestris TaxID=339 RepID=UPI002378DB01|nr:DGQHR domain-containing protein [Xanthomonas campestris]WDJ75396.1 DGQHR domain-containing protein [Xanthomonas campestris pv. campestris]